MKFSGVLGKHHVKKHTIGPSNNHLEAVSPLTFVVCLLSRHWSTPKSTFVVGRAGRVGAIVRVRINAGVAFDIHVESYTTTGLVAERCTSERVETCQRMKTHVVGGTE